MGEAEFDSKLIGFIMVAVFIFAILSFAVSMSSQYGKSSDQITGGALNLEPIQKHLENVESEAQAQYEVFKKGSIWDIGGVIVTTMFGVAKNVVTFVIFPFQFLNDIMVDILKIPPIITGVIWGMVLLTIIFAIWRKLKIGD